MERRLEDLAADRHSRLRTEAALLDDDCHDDVRVVEGPVGNEPAVVASLRVLRRSRLARDIDRESPERARRRAELRHVVQAFLHEPDDIRRNLEL